MGVKARAQKLVAGTDEAVARLSKLLGGEYDRFSTLPPYEEYHNLGCELSMALLVHAARAATLVGIPQELFADAAAHQLAVCTQQLAEIKARKAAEAQETEADEEVLH